MATVEAISKALELIDGKKQNLRKAFEDLQAHSSSLSYFTLTWPDLDSHFTSLQSSLQEKFNLFQSTGTQPQSQLQPFSKPLSSASVPSANNLSEPVRTPARPELKSFCQRMDGVGLREYIAGRAGERAAIWEELTDAWKYATDAAAMVLDAVEGVNGSKSVSMSGVCLGMLEELMKAKMEVKAETKVRAKCLAVEWKRKVNLESLDGKESMELLGFLQFLVTFGLRDVCNVDEIIEFFTFVARRRQATDLCRALIPSEKLPVLVEKLISSRKLPLAIKFIYEFGLTDKFQPVPLLKNYAESAKKLAKDVRKNGKNSRQSQHEAAAKEVGILRSIIKCIEDHNLEHEYPKDLLKKRIEKLENNEVKKKATNQIPPWIPNQKKQAGNKRLRTGGPAGPAIAGMNVPASSFVPLHYPQSHSMSSDFLHNSHPAGSSVYPSGLLMPSSYHDRSITNSGYGLVPLYRPSYHHPL